MVEKQIRANFQTGIIHYLGAYCPQANKMKHGNWQDFYSLVEAENELKSRGKNAKRCMRCGWPKNMKEELEQ